MKRIEFKILYGNPDGSRDEIVAIFARNINSGMKKAADRAVRNALQDEEVLEVKFWQVTM